MTYKVKSKKQKYISLSGYVEGMSRKSKETYLKNIGLFKESALRKMPESQLNELVYNALRVKGFKENLKLPK
jgi:hypothetical protein